jgi:hypothetical protein
MKIKKYFILFLLFFTPNVVFSQQKFPEFLSGTWISIQYDVAIKDSLDDRIKLNVSPQLIHFDSIGKVRIQTSFEQSVSIGRSIKIEEFGQEILITYLDKKRIYRVWYYESNKDYLFLTLPGSESAILFKRYMSKE